LQGYKQKSTYFWPILPEKFIFQSLPNISAGKHSIRIKQTMSET